MHTKPAFKNIFKGVVMRVNISNPIKDTSIKMIDFFFECHHPNDRYLSKIKESLKLHIKKCKIEAYANEKGTEIALTQTKEI